MDPTQPVQIENQPSTTPIPVTQPQSPVPKSPLNINWIILMIISIVVVVIVGGFLFSISRITESPKITPQILPPEAVVNTTEIETPTPTTIITDNPNDIDVGSVDADLKGIGVDVKNLQ